MACDHEAEMENELVKKMREEWDERARQNAAHFVNSEREQWDDEAFFRSGEINVANEIMPDMPRITGGIRSPRGGSRESGGFR